MKNSDEAYACCSVLNAVIVIQKIGKNSSSAIAQASTPGMARLKTAHGAFFDEVVVEATGEAATWLIFRTPLSGSSRASAQGRTTQCCQHHGENPARRGKP